MGLDQYAFVRTAADSDEKSELMYWRKHNRLQGWMENLWRTQKEGEGEFNCVDVELTEADLDALELAISNRGMPETVGFFFGPDSYAQYEEWHKGEDEEFLRKAREALKLGQRVFYSSWW